MSAAGWSWCDIEAGLHHRTRGVGSRDAGSIVATILVRRIRVDATERVRSFGISEGDYDGRLGGAARSEPRSQGAHVQEPPVKLQPLSGGMVSYRE
jgi:hypothetical protein